MKLIEWRQNSGLNGTEANMLITAVTHYSTGEIISRFYEILSDEALIALEALRTRRLAGEPMAYILGQREFYGRDFFVGPEVLIPRPETEHLIDYILHNFPGDVPLTVWDLGTGSGAIAVTLKLERPNWRLYASDISAAALQLARRNSSEWQVDIHFGQGSWFTLEEPWEVEQFDILVANPPYIKKDDEHLNQGDLRFEPKGALTDEEDGLKAYRTLAEGAGSYLTKEGVLCLEHGFDQAEEIRALLAAQGFRRIHTFRDYANLERVTVAFKSEDE